MARDNGARRFSLLRRFGEARSSMLIADDLAAWRGPRGYVENMAHAIALAATSELAGGHVYNFCEEPTLSELEWQTRIATQAKWAGRIVVLLGERTPKHLLQPDKATQHVVVSSARIRVELHYKETVDQDEALRRTSAWEHNNRPVRVNPQQFDYAAEDEAAEF
jgi:nucleoside-diphosphate-sugar epimerase